MAHDLLNCPFCGGEANGNGHIRYNKPLPDTWWDDGAEITEAFFVNCVKCGIANGSPGLVSGYQTKAEAIERWNTRTETQSQATIDELVGLAADFMDGCTNDECELCARGRALLSARKGEGNG